MALPGTNDPAVPQPDDRESSRVVLLLVLATGAMDAACLLHLGVFTAYVTASLILAGANLVDTPGSPVPGLVAVAGFVVGAVAGGWLSRRELRRHRRVAALLLVDAAFIATGAAVAAWQGIDAHEGRYAVIALLAIAMGCQTAAIRLVHVAEIPIAAATLATFGVVVGLTGEHGDRSALLNAPVSWWRSCSARSWARRWRAGNRGSRGPRLLRSWPASRCSRTGRSPRPEAAQPSQ